MDTAEAEAMQGKSALTESREASKLLQERYRTQNENEDVRDQNIVLGENDKEALLRLSDEYADAVSRCLWKYMLLRVCAHAISRIQYSIFSHENADSFSGIHANLCDISAFMLSDAVSGHECEYVLFDVFRCFQTPLPDAYVNLYKLKQVIDLDCISRHVCTIVQSLDVACNYAIIELP